MRKLNILSILSVLALLLLAPCPTAAELIEEAVEIPYQINTSDRIVIGTVSGIDIHYNHTIFTIIVEEWLYNPLPAETIKVRTETGSNFWTEDQAEFTLNESVLLMLRDKEPDKQLFSVSGGFPGKHPVSDRNAIIEELKVQGKWQDENKIEKTETVSEQPADSKSPSDTESTPFTGILWVVLAVVGAFMCTGKKK